MTSIYNSVAAYFSSSYEIAEKAQILYRKRNTHIIPYQMNDLGILEFAEINDRFFKLNTKTNGETYLNDLRNIIPRHRWHQGKTWTDFCFRFRPAIYHVIKWQKLPLIVSLLTSPEGKGWLNRSYHPLPSRVDQDPVTPEYPIHTAVRIACYFKGSQTDGDQSEQIVHTLLELNANVNQVDSLGKTPLHIAVEAKNFSVIQLLIERGGLVVVDSHKTPLSVTELCVLFRKRKTVKHNAQDILLTSTPLPSVIITIALRYLF